MDSLLLRYPPLPADSDVSDETKNTGHDSAFVVVLDPIVESLSKLRVKDSSETLDTADTWESTSVASNADGCDDSDTNEDARSNAFEYSSREDDWSWHSETYSQDSGDYCKDDAYFVDDSYFLDETEFSQGLAGYADDLANGEKEFETGVFWDGISHSAQGWHGGLRAKTCPVLAPIVEERSFDSL